MASSHSQSSLPHSAGGRSFGFRRARKRSWKASRAEAWLQAARPALRGRRRQGRNGLVLQRLHQQFVPSRRRDCHAATRACEPSLARPRTSALPAGIDWRSHAQLPRPRGVATTHLASLGGRQGRSRERHSGELHSFSSSQTGRPRPVTPAHDGEAAAVLRRAFCP